jgi:predicted alpha/beta hydrolase family esterase
MKRPLKIVLWLVAAGVALVVGFTGYQLIAVRGTFQKPLAASCATGTAITVGEPGHRLTGRMYVSGEASFYSPLVVVFHGDAPFRNPGYQYEFAGRLANAVPGTRVMALMRPGYTDAFGAKSDGDRGFAVGDNYDSATMNEVSRAVRAIPGPPGLMPGEDPNAATRLPAPTPVILVGHSGGAVTAANVAALHESNIVAAFLIGCPCDVPAFRRHMWELQHAPLWLWPVHAVSPLDTVNELPTTTEIRAISGAEDPIALPEYARAYVEKAKARGVDASLTLIPNEGHEILLEQSVIDVVAASVRAHTVKKP